MLCGGVIGYRALRLCGVRPGDVLGLYGFGASAHIVVQIALHRGCRTFVFTRSATHQELARRMGAEWVGQVQEKSPEELDSAIIFAPAGELVPLALGALKPSGILVLAGITMSTNPPDAVRSALRRAHVAQRGQRHPSGGPGAAGPGGGDSHTYRGAVLSHDRGEPCPATAEAGQDQRCCRIEGRLVHSWNKHLDISHPPAHGVLLGDTPRPPSGAPPLHPAVAMINSIS